MVIHTYVPLSMEELRGENINSVEYTVPVNLCKGVLVTRPLTPENGAPSFVHILFTVTSLFVTLPNRLVTHLRVTLLLAKVTAPGVAKSTSTEGKGTAYNKYSKQYMRK